MLREWGMVAVCHRSLQRAYKITSFTSKGLQNNKHLLYIINSVPVGGKVGGREGQGAEGV